MNFCPSCGCSKLSCTAPYHWKCSECKCIVSTDGYQYQVAKESSSAWSSLRQQVHMEKLMNSVPSVCPQCTNSGHVPTHPLLTNEDGTYCPECGWNSVTDPNQPIGRLQPIHEPSAIFQPKLSKTEKLFQAHEGICSMALSIMRSKNHDYCAGNPDADPFANFRVSEVFSGTPAAQGILIRMVDKFQRLKCFVQTGSLQVKEEQLDDIIVDFINYLVLLRSMISEQQHLTDFNENSVSA